jgi:hypothetical protein
MQTQGIFLLLGAHGCREVALWLESGLIKKLAKSSLTRSFWSNGSALALGLALSAPFVTPLTDIIEGGGNGWLRYDQAFTYVQDNLGDGEKVMTMHPPASLLYLNRSDYYLVQSSPKLIVRPDGALGDRYSGAVWLETAEEFNALMAGSPKTWFVAEEFWLFNSYDGYLQQQILQQMDKVWGEGGVWALASRPVAWPLAREVNVVLNAEFQGGARLLGFTADPAELQPGGVMRLTLFWQGNIPHGAKILVHLRDRANNTITQADHFIYDGKVPSSRWPSLLENDIAVRDGAALALPPELKPGTYRILVGFYHPATFERLGVVDDQSGESAVVLGEWSYAPD